MEIRKIAAFSEGNIGGNPAGVVFTQNLPTEKQMQSIAADIGYSETVFAEPINKHNKEWRVRYFSPESEVPFCGHATIALGAALEQKFSLGNYQLQLNHTSIKLSARTTDCGAQAQLSAADTHSRLLKNAELKDLLNLFNLNEAQLHPILKPARIYGGSDHALLVLNNRIDLSNMNYDFDKGKTLMGKQSLVTIMLAYPQSDNLFYVRNAFASGGVFEDPATGAAAAAFGAYLRSCNWPIDKQLTIKQGQDMGMPSTLYVDIPKEVNGPILVSGFARPIAD